MYSSGHTAGTQSVDCFTGNGIRYAGQEQGHPGYVAIVLAGLIGTPKYDIGNCCGIKVWVAH